eukprot:4577539-Alexandrium_andersonii.AAC.1
MSTAAASANVPGGLEGARDPVGGDTNSRLGFRAKAQDSEVGHGPVPPEDSKWSVCRPNRKRSDPQSPKSV